MFFKEKFKRSMDTMNERNRRYIEKMDKKSGGDKNDADQTENAANAAADVIHDESEAQIAADDARMGEAAQQISEDEQAAQHEYKEYIPAPDALSKENLEKGDVPALVISALLTFVPVILLLLAVMFLFVWLLS